MPHPRFTSEEIARRGAEIYATRLRDQLEPQHEGKVVVIDIETGDYEIDDNSLAANRRALQKHPGAALYGVRVGYDAVESFSGGPRHSKR